MSTPTTSAGNRRTEEHLRQQVVTEQRPADVRIINQILGPLARRMIARRQKRMAAYVVGKNILDIGAADAPNPFLRSEGRFVTAIDLQDFEAEEYDCIRQGELGDVDNIFDEGEFDTILMGEVLEHLPDPLDTLSRLERILAPGGRLIITVPNPLGFPQIIAECLCLQGYFYTPAHLFVLPPRWVRRLLEVAGFQLEQMRSLGLWITGLPCPVSLSHWVLFVTRKR